MLSALAALVIAFLATTVLTPLVRSRAISAGVVDAPGGRRVHQKITPRLGGVAVIAGFFTPLGVFAVVQTNAMRGFMEHQDLVLGLVLGSALVGIVGAVDDVRSLGPSAKLCAQTVAAVVAYAFGYRILAVDIPLFGTLEMGVFALPVTIVWFLAIINAINLIDGLDGLAVGIALFATVANLSISYLNGSYVVMLLSAALAGSLLGFLRYNFNPATIFLGDSGSMFLGFALAATSLSGATTKSSTAIAILAPIIALGVPIMDTLLAMVRRTLARRSIFSADRGHIHHRLLDLGVTHRRVVLILYGLSIALALAAVSVAFGRSMHVGAALSLVGGVLFAIVRWLKKMSRTADSGARDSRQSQLAAFSESIGSALRSLSGAQDEASVRETLNRLRAELPALQVRLLASGPEAGDETDAEIVSFDLSGWGRTRFLAISIDRPLSVRDTEVASILADLVDACRQAIERSSRLSNPSAMRLGVVSAHATGRED